MTFNSLPFLIFLPVMVILYYVLPHRWRWVLLLAGSYYFYRCWRPEYIVLIIFSTFVDYFMAIMMEKYEEKRKRRKFLLVSIVSNLGLLFAFKYFDFFRSSATVILHQFNILDQLPELHVLLPVGISFYSFQALSYTIDVYNGHYKAERHPGYFALFITYFPQLVAGPIERYDRLAPQLQAFHKPVYENFANGFRMVLYGLFIKMAIADNLAVYVEQIYSQPADYNTFSILTGLVFYSFQIYADFFGYSTIAIGAALLMGVNLMDNFRTPYLAGNISEFWKRWHISLSTWFRDYLYIPLGGNKVKISRWALNIFIVFTVSGLWHGANWTFVIWGAVFGIVFLAESFFRRTFGWTTPEKWTLLRFAGVLKTFTIVTLAWIFFRSENLEKAKMVFSSLWNNTGKADNFHIDPVILVLFGFFVLSDILLFNKRFDVWCAQKPVWLRWGVYFVLLFALMGLSGTDNQPFIYFQF
jgi:D-alanyl-lipoteichoic acid acyltransferase DltB (MBOAT superfamily)